MKKLLVIPCIVGMMGLGYVSSAKAFESKIKTDSPVTNTRIIEHSDKTVYSGIMTLKTLANGVEITETDDNRDGKPDGLLIYQPGPLVRGKGSDSNTWYNKGILEMDKGADGDIDYRITFNGDGSAWYEEQLPDGSVKIELIKG